MNVGSLFSGIGGLDLGLERAGMRVKWQCEVDPYCRAVLAHHWPGVKCYEDIRDIDASAEQVDLICGGFPCQPVSLAGKGLAQKDPRWLWPEFARVVRVLRPRYVLVENVPGLTRRGLDLVITGLAEMGYDAEWEVVSAAACGAPHLRERLFIVGYANCEGQFVEPLDAEVEGESECLADTDSQRRTNPQGGERSSEPPRRKVFSSDNDRFRSHDWLPEPSVGRVADGVPNRMAQLRALGNAVVPQVAEAVGRMILASA